MGVNGNITVADRGTKRVTLILVYTGITAVEVVTIFLQWIV